MAENELKRYLKYLGVLLIVLGALFAVKAATAPREPSFSWKPVSMDGHRSGALCVTQENVDYALGTFRDDEYEAPSGRVYALDTPIAKAAATLMEVQPGMAYLKEVIGHSARMMDNTRNIPDIPLGNLVADALREQASIYYQVPVDFAICNYGGIRVPMPEGAVTLDDISSMFPFKNYMCLAQVKGENLTRLLEQLAGTDAFQPISGATVKVKAHQLQEALVGGEPIDPRKVYRVATIDFLLDGGDQIRIGALAQDVKLSRVLLQDVMLNYIRGCEAQGKVIDSQADGRVVMED